MKSFYLGVDVSKKKLDFCLLSNHQVKEQQIVQNTTQSIADALESMLSALNIDSSTMVVCAEFTGAYTYPLICACKRVGVTLWLEDAAKIKYSGGLQRGKSDKVDAWRIASYAQRFIDSMKPYIEDDEIIVKLEQLYKLRNKLVTDRAAYRILVNERKGYINEDVLSFSQQTLNDIQMKLSEAIESIETEIQNLIAHSPKLSRQMEILTSIDGVGEQVALKVIITTKAFTKFDNARKFCCHAGIAPFPYMSGSSIRGRTRVSYRADKTIKTSLHLAALATISMRSSVLKNYFERKVSEGKNKMSVINAIRVKLVTIMFALIKNDQLFSKNYAPKFA